MIGNILGAIAVLVIFLILGVFVLELAFSEYDGIKEVDCYDRYTNKIEGLVCYEKQYCTNFITGGKTIISIPKCSEVMK